MTGIDQNTDDRYLSIKEAAAELDVHYLTARSYVANGHLFALPFGKRYRIPTKEIERFKQFGNYPNGAAAATPAAAIPDLHDEDEDEGVDSGIIQFQ